MKNYIIKEKDLIQMLRYLETRPYKEVAEGIKMLSTLEEIKDKPVSKDASK